MSGKLIKAKVTGKPVKAVATSKKKNRKQDATLINVDALKAEFEKLKKKVEKIDVHLYLDIRILQKKVATLRTRMNIRMTAEKAVRSRLDRLEETWLEIQSAKILTCNSDGKEALTPLIPSVQSQENLAS